MSGAHHAVPITTAIADQLHWKMMEANVVSDLFERSRVQKRSDAVNPHLKILRGHRRADRDHVLLCDARVDESGAHRLLQRLQSHETEVAGKKHHVLAVCPRDERFAELLPHRLPISSTAS